jgi:preprotein translocase subunit YajC
MASLIPLLLMFVVMYFLLIRPQQQRVRRQQALITSLNVGDEVVTAGGIFGRIVAMEGETVSLEVSPGVTVRVVRPAITRRLADEDPEA